MNKKERQALDASIPKCKCGNNLSLYRQGKGIDNCLACDRDDVVNKDREGKMKIIQIFIGPDTSSWQGHLVGLGDDGNVYVESQGKWALELPGLSSEKEFQEWVDGRDNW